MGSVSANAVQVHRKSNADIGISSACVRVHPFAFVGEGIDERLVILTGVACGLGIGTLMVCWFSFLAFVPERYAMLTQGGQAFLGSVFFIAISGLFAVHASVGALIALGVSAVFSVVVYRRGNAATPLSASQGSLRINLRTLWNKGNLSQSFTTSLLAFAVISLLYGIITAVIMSPETTIDALDQTVLGGIVGAVLFLAWAFLSKKRDYGVVLKGFFGIVAFILILPIEGHGSIMAAGYQLISLLFFSLVIDTFHANRRSLMLALSLSYALTRGLFCSACTFRGISGCVHMTNFSTLRPCWSFWCISCSWCFSLCSIGNGNRCDSRFLKEQNAARMGCTAKNLR